MTVFGLGLTFAPVAWATPASETCAALAQARTSLYSILHAKDKPAQDALKAKIQASSTKIDSALASLTGADAKVAADFKAVWDQFTATRDTEIIPAIDKGNFEDAKKSPTASNSSVCPGCGASCPVPGELPGRTRTAQRGRSGRVVS